MHHRHRRGRAQPCERCTLWPQRGYLRRPAARQPARQRRRDADLRHPGDQPGARPRATVRRADCTGQADQRVRVRPAGSACDVGAYEYGPRTLTVDAAALADPAALLFGDLQSALDAAMTGDLGRGARRHLHGQLHRVPGCHHPACRGPGEQAEPRAGLRPARHPAGLVAHAPGAEDAGRDMPARH